MYVYSVLKLYTHANKVHSGILVAIQILNKSISRFFPMTNIWQIVTAFQAARSAGAHASCVCARACAGVRNYYNLVN